MVSIAVKCPSCAVSSRRPTPAAWRPGGSAKILNAHFRTDVCIATASFRICFRNGPSWGWLMGLSGSPSLLAFVALVGFVLVQAVLKFAF
jgi:hypothetical protein